MNLKEIKDMINLMNENDLVELELERDGLRVRLKKKAPSVYEQKVEKLVSPPSSLPQFAALEEKVKPPPVKLIEIKAPIVGTFYRAPSPDSAAFVEVEDKVEVGQVVCIIEAMKLMNEIKSEVKGKIIEILIENGDPVEFGQTLFLVEPI